MEARVLNKWLAEEELICDTCQINTEEDRETPRQSNFPYAMLYVTGQYLRRSSVQERSECTKRFKFRMIANCSLLCVKIFDRVFYQFTR